MWGSGSIPGGGLSTFYSEGDPSTLQTAVKAMFAGSSFLSLFPVGVGFTVPAEGDTFESTTGLIGSPWASGTAGLTAGSASGGYAGAVGTRIVWNTTGIRNRRRVRGSTFLVPLIGACYDSGGNMTDGTLTIINASAQALIVALGDDLCIWSRPTPGTSDGMLSTVTSRSVPDKVSWLRSRRT